MASLTVYGAGAIGGITGGALARAGHDVVDGQIGLTVVKADALGVPVSVTRRLVELIRDVESGRRPMGWATLDELVVTAERTTER